MEEWKEDKLIDLLDQLIDYRGKTPVKTESGVPLITAKIIKNGRIETPTEYIAEDNYDSWMVRGLPKEGDVVLTTEAPLGEVAQLDDRKIALAQRTVCLRGKNGILDNKYLKYYFLSNIGHSRLCARETGTTVTGIKQSELKEVLVSYPSYEIQLRISEILSSLDNKIELNRRINDNLEQQAQALFKSWFVDFDPFKDGKFVDSELGMIPEGWRVVTLSSFITPFTEKVLAGSLPEYSVTNNGIIPRSGKYKKQLSSSTSKNKVLRKFNLVFGMSREILNWGIMLDEIGGVSSAYNIYSIDDNVINPLYLKYYMESKISYFNDLIGTAAREGQALDKGGLDNKLILVPPFDIWCKFQVKDTTLKKTISTKETETVVLTNLRDSILPKLMSGEIKINDLNC
ncbi:restriction endonuclease subunit S [Macellibacteroides fermentans]|uniref:Type I restriction enzyme S subunit n=1 Tax=Macellibacteroides fermentans TaxID=879969 RepID=A0A8E1ZZN5_9PORP|nr:restriction endonuclease subunit S [Macellibacteroides fermentans]NYI48835.1 type I restriction enzyme S subunit [Macellibacteroides fermentans]